MYQVKLQQFEGPLDLLLKLIEERKISINEISLAWITEEFINYARNSDGFLSENTVEFLDTASTLILIKSKSLLPSLEVSEKEDISIKELQQRLNLYKIFKKLASDIENKFGTNIIFARSHFLNVKPNFIEPKNASVGILSGAIEEIIRFLPTAERLPQKRLGGVFSLEQKINEIQSRLQSIIQISFSKITESKDRLEAIISFLAVLELIKQGYLMAEQDNNFGEIKVIKI